MARQTWKIPDDFILGAAASAWQTEGWDGKRPDTGFLFGYVVQK
ncbi:hypothetical protein CHCC15075_3416 [Bacillus licheniformis]|nr:Beta-glucosidase [Bacillus licheniformis]OLG05955.1 Beta-glucosidase [Bacillus licheniformis]TWJ51175.1 hypothetical protein CHCC5024_2949 [Bacillus licheniformis]TWK04842.1 hypothetical protein CHCC20442_2998 [Bacillus licheniformis]TWL44497.1 hypothetical protein CHCC15543_0262 [Bacillus licheniformis]